MTVEAPPVGRLPVGAFARGRVGGHPLCGSCGHAHRVTDSTGALVLTYDIRCPVCGCTSNGTAYDRGIVTLPVNFDHDDGAGCPVHGTFPRCLPDGHGDGRGARGVVTGSRLRGGWMDRLVWPVLSRLAGDFCHELVRERGDVGRVGGRPDHGGRTYSGGPAGPDELRRVVTP